MSKHFLCDDVVTELACAELACAELIEVSKYRSVGGKHNALSSEALAKEGVCNDLKTTTSSLTMLKFTYSSIKTNFQLKIGE